jgi:hypothetical protein
MPGRLQFGDISDVGLNRVSKSPAFEKHFSPKELASIWGLDVSTVCKMLRDEPGVLKISFVSASSVSTVRCEFLPRSQSAFMRSDPAEDDG